MAPIEILGKLVKPFALAVRLFGNMTAGHFVILSLFGIIFLFGGLQGWNWIIGGSRPRWWSAYCSTDRGVPAGVRVRPAVRGLHRPMAEH
jgi:hypothetical protein